MLPSSEILIKPGKSESYQRLVLVIDVITVGLIAYSSLYLLLKLALVTVLLKLSWNNKSPNPDIKEIYFVRSQWVLVINNGKKQRYNDAQILVNNILFQLIQFKTPKKKRTLVLFHDQASTTQLRLLHLKIAQN